MKDPQGPLEALSNSLYKPRSQRGPLKDEMNNGQPLLSEMTTERLK